MATKASPVTAADVMQRDLITARERDTLQDAMQLMTENHVTGLPVMNAKSQCIGVVTASDILGYEQEHAEFTSEANANMARHFNPDKHQWESVRVTSYALEEFGEIRVTEVMSRDLISVQKSTPLPEVARKMRDQRVHRVLVVDDESRLFGIVSAFDFVKLFADENRARTRSAKASASLGRQKVTEKSRKALAKPRAKQTTQRAKRKASV